MAIQINGDGTITGINVGGLPNGIVDTDMIAANAVSSAKLASGAGGKIVQVKYVTTGTNYTTGTSSTFTHMPAFDLSITPTSASNRLILNVSIAAETWHGSTQGGPLHIGITDDNGSSYLIERRFYPYRYDTGGIYKEGELGIITDISAGSTNARTYKIYHKASGSVSNTSINQESWDKSSFVIYEVAA